MRIKALLRAILFGGKNNNDIFIQHLRNKGVRIGEGSVFFDPKNSFVDETSPYMIKIGNNVQITSGVKILSHDYAWSVTKGVYGDVLGSIRPVEIGNNVYIGMNTLILAGARIGNNVIIGANSIVTREIPDNCVALGSPCKYHCSLNEYHERRKKMQIKEAVDMVKNYYEVFGEMPEMEIFYEHFWLFTNEEKDIPKSFCSQNNLIKGSEEKTLYNYRTHQPSFASYQDFLSYARRESGI